MDPFTALALASLLTWGTVGGGIKDTAAILKGQSPPSYAYRTAKLAASERERKAANALIQQAIDKGEPIPAALEPRRIRIKDLMRHWWEDALEDADAWRARRHKTRPERKGARKARLEEKKSRIERGYELLKRRGEERFATPEPAEHRDPEEPKESEGGREAHKSEEEGDVPDNVIPLNGKKPGRDESAADAPFGEALGGLADLSEQDKSQLTRDLEAKNKNTISIDAKEAPVAIDLSDAPTLAAHLKALNSYTGYLSKIASDMDALAAGMRSHQMGEIAITEVTVAGMTNAEAASEIRQMRALLEQAHTRVAEARQAAPDAADGDYLTRGK